MVPCTACALGPHRKQLLRVGLDDIVIKPLAKRELLSTTGLELETPSSSEFEVPEGVLSGIELPPLPTTLPKITTLVAPDSPHDIEALKVGKA